MKVKDFEYSLTSNSQNLENQIWF